MAVQAIAARTINGGATLAGGSSLSLKGDENGKAHGSTPGTSHRLASLYGNAGW